MKTANTTRRIVRRTIPVGKPRSSPTRPTVPVVNSVKKRATEPIIPVTSLSFSSLNSYFSYASGVLLNTEFLLYFIVAMFAIFNYHSMPENSYVTKIVSNIFSKASAYDKCTYTTFIMAFIPFIPVILSVSSNMRILSAILCFAFYKFFPEKTYYEYLVFATCIYLAVKTKNKVYRFISIILLAFLYFIQFALPFPTDNTLTCRAPASKPN